MNRRAFFAALAGSAAAAADPERLLWMPGKRLISIPKPRVIAAGEVLSVNLVGTVENQGYVYYRIPFLFPAGPDPVVQRAMKRRALESVPRYGWVEYRDSHYETLWPR